MQEKEFGSVYINRETGKKLKVKRLDCNQILVLDPESGQVTKASMATFKKLHRHIKKESTQFKFGKFRRM